MQALLRELRDESLLTPYFGEPWLRWLRERAAPATRARIDALIETADASNAVYAEYLREGGGRDATLNEVAAAPDAGGGDRAAAARVLDAVLRPNLRKAYRALDPDLADVDWAEAFRALQHARALVAVTEDALRDMDARVGRALLREALGA